MIKFKVLSILISSMAKDRIFRGDSKLTKALAGILRDFKPWTNPARPYRWGSSHVVLTKEEIKALPPYSVYLTLV
jgi:hypothetical protein